MPALSKENVLIEKGERRLRSSRELGMAERKSRRLEPRPGGNEWIDQSKVFSVFSFL